MVDFLVVGSGAAGATIAKELARNEHGVTIIEAGGFHKLGSAREALKYYTGGFLTVGEKSREGTEILRTMMVGGSSTVTIGNGVRALEEELRSHGIDLSEEFSTAERELGVKPIPESSLGERSKRLREASENLGYEVNLMPKFVDFSKCRGCGNCALGCMYGAKWTSMQYIAEARRHGAKLVTDSKVENVLHQDGRVTGLQIRDKDGISSVEGEAVVLSAGGLGSPVILQNSGLKAGHGLFADLLENTFGVVKDAEFDTEIGMSTIIDLHDKEGFIVSPFVDEKSDMLLYLPLFKKLRALKTRQMMGLMVKIADEPIGRVEHDGRIIKPVTEQDRTRLDRGHEIAKSILVEAGADAGSIFRTHVRAAHPGGTAAIGMTVNKDLETEVEGLYVCDASVLPETPGRPPLLTLVALAKKFSNLITA
jgi:choline dehydrogenase-like flavoprotein